MVVVRKYFWLVRVAAIAVCSFFAAKATGTMVAEMVRTVLPGGTLASRSAGLEEGRTRDASTIVARNIFCSTCAPSVAGIGDEPGVERDLGAAVGTSLRLQLVATMVGEEPRHCYAAIRDEESGRTGIFGVGSTVSGKAVISAVTERRVTLLIGKGTEYLDLIDRSGDEGAPGGGRVGGARELVNRKQKEVGDHGDGGRDLARGIRKVAANRWEIQRDVVRKALSGGGLASGSGRIVPTVSSGRTTGLGVYGVRPGSLYSLLGISSGDRVTRINGHAISTPDKALEMYTKLSSAGRVTVSLSRKGKDLVHEYVIR